MKKRHGWIISASVLLVLNAGASIIQIDLSPVTGDALSPANYVNGDHVLGLAAPNSVGQPPSPATGNEIGAGIFFDDVSKVLTYNIGYGSDFGFVDLIGTYSTAHIHGPVAVQFPAPNTGAGVTLGLAHTPGTSPQTGSLSGSAVLIPSQEADLFNNLLYINVHSSFAGGGEIRGQLVPVIPEPTTLSLLALSGVVIWRLRHRYQG